MFRNTFSLWIKKREEKVKKKLTQFVETHIIHFIYLGILLFYWSLLFTNNRSYRSNEFNFYYSHMVAWKLFFFHFEKLFLKCVVLNAVTNMSSSIYLITVDSSGKLFACDLKFIKVKVITEKMHKLMILRLFLLLQYLKKKSHTSIFLIHFKLFQLN